MDWGRAGWPLGVIACLPHIPNHLPHYHQYPRPVGCAQNMPTSSKHWVFGFKRAASFTQFDHNSDEFGARNIYLRPNSSAPVKLEPHQSRWRKECKIIPLRTNGLILHFSLYCATRAPLLYFITSWVALSFKVVSQWVRRASVTPVQISTFCNI